jgi:hypothetical protein
MNRNKLFAIVVVAGAIAISVAAIAQGSGGGKKSASKASAGPSSAGHPPGAIIGGGPGPRGAAVHSVSVVPNKAGTGFVTVTSDRGKVQSVDGGASTITIVEGTKTTTYKTVTLSVPSGAAVIRNGKSASLGDVKAADEVSVSSSSEGTTVFATDSTFHPEHGFGRGRGPGMPGPPPGDEASGAELRPGTGTKSGGETTTSTQ